MALSLPFSPSLSWKRIMCMFFLPFILSSFGPRAKYKGNRIHKGVKPSQISPPPIPRFNYCQLTPLELKDRYLGLQTESRDGSKPHFTLEGQKFLIFGGSIHYFRVPREYWRDRLLKLQACGFNTVTTYVPWNLHEPERGKFDFSGNLDLEAFILMAAEIGLWVILRPGPYICSEIDLGGLPSWLLRDPKVILRTTEKGFVEAVDKYFNHLIPRVVPLQYHRGGPIIAVQVENEYGSFGKDEEYMPYLQKAMLKRGIVEMLLTSDNEKELQKGSIKGVLATINMNTLHKNVFKQLHKLQPNKPILIMEYWVGWFDTWGYAHMSTSAKDVENTVSEFINLEISFNAYMFHGGTNFGFINGATNYGMHKGVTTSYAAPLPPLPQSTLKTQYPVVKPSLYLPLWDVLQYLSEPVISNRPMNMENLPINNGNGQSYGFILYETHICSGGQLHAEVHDLAQVFVNETLIGFMDATIKKLHIPKIKECQLLRILVENQGRINYSWQMQHERKGLIGSVVINRVLLKDFTIYSLEMKTSFFERLRTAAWRPVPQQYVGPAFYLGILKTGSSPMDTFLSLPDWKLGSVFINGRHLGRYWNIGPQETLYLPGVWLHPEDNEIILFEEMMSGSDIHTTPKPKLFSTMP
ncbi:beta-galactosidase-1-like protein 3 isoform X2 [Talpa occidentalis]|uniref:beta-galactosidase-1-like protein 3 isoform X2 n=1 Tax=Talpa occidentalis TaxID=50954 RepID=UPI0023F6663C|nr:beta-galactosidase-1-like protein 3 isoform X2 [Talpa occidentalis]